MEETSQERERSLNASSSEAVTPYSEETDSTTGMPVAATLTELIVPKTKRRKDTLSGRMARIKQLDVENERMKEQLSDERAAKMMEYATIVGKYRAEAEATAEASVIDTAIAQMPSSLFDLSDCVDIGCVNELKGHRQKVYTVSCSPTQGSNVATTARDGKLKIWDIDEGVALHSLSISNEFNLFGVYSPSGYFFSCGGLDNMCSVYDVSPESLAETHGVKKFAPVRKLISHEQYLTGCGYIGDDDNRLVTSSGDRFLLLWDVPRKLVAATLDGHFDEVNDVSTISGLGDEGNPNIVLSASADGSVKVWDLRAKKYQLSFSMLSEVNAVEWFPDRMGRTFVVGKDNGVCALFDIRVKSGIVEYNPVSGAQSMSPSLDGEDEDELLGRMHEARSTMRMSPVNCVRFSDSGALLVVSYTTAPHCLLWNTVTGEMIGELPHDQRVSDVALSNDGETIVTASWDRTVKLWTSGGTPVE